MSYQFRLPKKETQAAEVIERIIQQGKGLRSPQQTRWFIAALYLQGLREFSHIDYQAGTVSISYLNEAGILKFRHEEIIAKYTTQMGRLMALDLSPAVERRGVSLDGVRKASVAQVVLDAAVSQDKISRLKIDLIPPLLMYGTVGVAAWIEGEDSQGIEVIPPWQLFPIPVNIAGPNEVRGVIRVRPVPTEWVKNLQITPNKGTKTYKNLDDVKIPAGHMPIDLDTMSEGLMSMTSAGGGFFVRHEDMKNVNMATGRKEKKDEVNKAITQLVEVWTETSDGFLAEYAIYAGMSKLTELYRYDHTAQKYHMPVRVIRDTVVGSFWGRSYVDQLIPLNNELEYALSSIFQAVNDFDLYGFLLWPNTLGTPAEAERGQDGIKKMRYETDYTCPEQRPEMVEPAKLVAPQIQAVQLASGLMDKVANQPSEMLSGGAPGRVDSSAGLGFLYEVSGIPISPAAKNVADGLSGVYRAILRLLKDRWSDKKVVNVSSLDDSLAGIVLDAEAGTLNLSQNAIPYPDEVSVTIASEVPVSKEQMKQELKEALKEQRITLDEFNWTVRKEGLNIPVGDEVAWQNYRRAMLENILLFGDGETPGKAIVSEHDLHRVHLQVLQAFVARPEFYSASPQVREKFYEHINEHKGAMGVYPEQLPYMEDTAAATLGMPPEGETMPPQGEFQQY
jgi:hypothetical protein